LPSFRRATVQPGDLLYPIGVCDQVLYALGRIRVREIVPVGQDNGLLEEYLARYRAWRFLAPTCTTEVVIGSEGTGILLDRPLPGEIHKRLTDRPRRGPRPVRHVSDDGRLMHSLSVQGIYRLAESSAADMETVLAGPPSLGGVPRTFTSERHPRPASMTAGTRLSSPSRPPAESTAGYPAQDTHSNGEGQVSELRCTGCGPAARRR
jgi:hypothetical protein